MSEYIYATNGELVANIDGEISLAREEIVRCRDCKWLSVYEGDSYCECDYMKHVKLDGFCSGGERK